MISMTAQHEKSATITLKLRADSGYSADTEYRISAQQWGDILRLCEDKQAQASKEGAK